MSRAPTAGLSIPARVTRSFEIACTTIIAWSFGLITAGILLLLAYRVWSGNQPSALTPLSIAPAAFSAGVEQSRPWGLTYAGQNGAALALGEALGVLIALGLSMMFGSAARRLGLLLMIGWSGLWAVNAVIILAGAWSHSWWHVSAHFLGATLALFVILAAMVHRAARLWRIPIAV